MITSTNIITILLDEKIISYSDYYKGYVVNSNIYKKPWEEELKIKYPWFSSFFEKFSNGLKEMVYCLNNGITEPPKCPYCNKGYLKFYPSGTKKEKYYKTCGNPECIKKSVEATSLELYGVTHPKKAEIVKNKTVETNLSKYGVSWPTQNEEIMAKVESSNRNNHGGFWNNQLREDIEKRQTTNRKNHGGLLECQTSEGKQKRKDTCAEKYGVEHPAQNSDIKKKTLETNMEKYGVPHPAQLDEIKQKMKETTKERYGCDYYSQSEDYKLKTKNTCKVKYGVDYWLQAPENKEMIREVCESKYNVKNISQVEKIKEKKCQKAQEKYGVNNVSQSEEIKIKKYKTALNHGFILPKEMKDDYQRYKDTVAKLTEKTYFKYIEEINPKRLNRGVSNNSHHLDHKFSIFQGFLENIPEEVIASKINLELINARDNRSKGKNCSWTKEDLLNQFSKLDFYFKKEDLLEEKI